MAVAHVNFNDQTHHGRQLRRGLQQIEEGRQNLNAVLGIIEQMRDGDGSVASHYAYATVKFGCTNDADTKKLYDDLKVVMDKLNTNASVTQVKAVLDILAVRFA